MSKNKMSLYRQLYTKILDDIAVKEKQLDEYVPVEVEQEEECVVDDIVSEFNLKGYIITHSYCGLGGHFYHWLEIKKVENTDFSSL